MSARSEQSESTSPEYGAVPVRLGDTVEDTKTRKVGRVVGFVGPYVQLRPVGGGLEWDARPERLRPVTAAEALSAGPLGRTSVRGVSARDGARGDGGVSVG